MTEWLTDFKYGLRMLLKRPGTSAIAVVALGLGIGLTTTMFSIIQGAILRGLPVEDLRKNLTEVIATAQGRHIKVLLTGMEAPPNYGPAYTSDFRRVYQELARTPGVTFMPFYLEGVAGNPELNIRDGIHPNPEGARIVERNVWKVLEPLLDKPAR